MIHLVKTGNNGPRCIEYRMYLITSISLFAIMRFKLARWTTCENLSIMSLVEFKTCPSVDNLEKLLGRLLMWLTSSSTFFMNSLILSPDPGMRERDIFILAAKEPVRSSLVSNKLSSAWNAYISEHWYYLPFSIKSTIFPSCFPSRTLKRSLRRYPR